MTAVKPLTNYLGEIYPADYTSASYNGYRITTLPETAKAIFGKYEAVLTHAAYMSRLIYEPNAVIAHAVKLTEYDPVVFNTGLGMIRSKYGRFGETSLSNTVSVPSVIGNGQVLYRKEGLVETPVYLQVFDFTGESIGPFAGEKIVYVVFRGTVSIKSGLADVNAGLMGMDKLLGTVTMGGILGTDAFSAEISEGAGTINSFSAHRGFVDNLLPVMDDTCKALEKILATETGITRIVVTGHSLGGANASLAALVLAGFRRAGAITQKLHCITFGAPKCLTDMTRNVFNSMLDAKILTLDRVAGRSDNLLIGLASGGVAMDLVTTIPAHFVHPGYMVLKTEIKTQSRTGRSKQISELRQMFAGMDIPGWKNFNTIPTYPEFMANFKPVANSTDVYTQVITTNWFGTLFSNTTHKPLYEAIKALINGIDIGEEEAKTDAAIAASQVNTVPAAQSGGGKYTDAYKAATVERGPNHIVYMCHKNVSGAACHFGYMGISFNGVIKNLSLSREPYATFMKSDDTLVYQKYDANQVGGKRKRVRKTRKGLRLRKQRKTRKH